MTTEPPTSAVLVSPVVGMPEVRAGDDLAALVAEHATDLRDGDIVVVSSKVVSKAEGRVVTGDRAAAVEAETVRVVAERGTTRIVQTRHGFVMAAAGVDTSNVATGSVVLLPVDPDASARALRRGLARRRGVTVGVIVTDTFGRPWRLGQTDLAVGAAGVRVLDDYRGRRDVHGNELVVTAPALADELASAADLVKGKLGQVPVAVVRGLAALVTSDDGPGVQALVRSAEDDLFRLGSREAARQALRPAPRELVDGTVDPVALQRAFEAVAETETPWWGLVRVHDVPARKPLLDALSLPASLPALVVPYLRPNAPTPAALLDLGGVRERLVLACAVEGLATRWFPAERLDVAALMTLLPSRDVEPVGLLAIGAAAETRA
ncbi:coenzyme F420-0:L-glutamate ligase [Thermasporomyces composti]|jgi:coenzyme F420-0:L-glutamate ligase/coenzyme F420-1:gamma-L-glutamate ligase|uniref:Coenzyme F420-0:L-glutamate ligase n=1 Tax=Thermasporomyces composti TaxID=696763 RepID=A0A3D9VH53_THECX|nr:coenzyme F420-0:L-glutamate ligase [Thermasporomyces composti]REF37514.1 coenzyme F420-0:L-glutamate ligase [Thermasporomyces composti]